ncbi:MAG: sensor domain-containing diguanylate cyclase [Planctomycetota bacterium]
MHAVLRSFQWRRLRHSQAVAVVFLSSATALAVMAILTLLQSWGWLQINIPTATFWVTCYALILGSGTILYSSALYLSRVQKLIPGDLQYLLDHVPDAFVILDEHDLIIYANDAFGLMLQTPDTVYLGRPIETLDWQISDGSKFPWHRASGSAGSSGPVTRDASKTARGVTAHLQDQLITYAHPDGQQRLFAVHAKRISGNSRLSGMCVVSVRDATIAERYRAEMEGLLAQTRVSSEEVQRRNEKLNRLVREDSLTGCQNRRALDDTLPLLWNQNQTEESPFSCLMFDIDRFKSVNDTHGHAQGDEVLRQVGEKLRDTFAGVGQVYRYGGEEFCVLLPRHNHQEAHWIAERIRQSIEELEITSSPDQDAIRPTVSIGVADLSHGAEDAPTLVAQADKCLYIAKRRGRNQVVVYDQEVREATIRRSDR